MAVYSAAHSREGTIFSDAQKLLSGHLSDHAAGISRRLNAEVISEIILLKKSLEMAEVYSLNCIEEDISNGREYKQFNRHPDRVFCRFELPAQYTYVEDLVSGMLIIDPKPKQVGMNVERYYLRIARYEAKRNSLANDCPSPQHSKIVEFSQPQGSLEFTRGTIRFESNIFPAGVRPLVVISIISNLDLSPRGASHFLKDFIPPTGLNSANAGIWKSLSKDLPCAFREIAYITKNDKIRPI